MKFVNDLDEHAYSFELLEWVNEVIAFNSNLCYLLEDAFSFVIELELGFKEYNILIFIHLPYSNE